MLEAEEVELSPLALIKRSRLAIAVAVTLAAVPLLVLDNMSATAETSEARVGVAASAGGSPWPELPTTVAAVPPTSTTAAPTTTTTAAPTTTTEAPTTTEAVAVQAVRTVTVAPPTTLAPPPTSPPTTAAPASYGDASDSATWDRLGQCESGGNWALNNGNGYYGGLQFSLATWRNLGGTGYPHQATKAEQIARGKILQARAGWGQWPGCARALGLG